MENAKFEKRTRGSFEARWLGVLLFTATAVASSAQTFTSLYSFCQNGCQDGFGPRAGLVQGTDGNLYGTTSYGGSGSGTVFVITPGGTLTTIYTFCAQGGCRNLARPSGVILGTNGDLYGTTTGQGSHDAGTVFQLTPGGTLTTLYNFCSQTGCTDGYTPAAGVIQAADGNFYGTTTYGGATGEGPASGTIFKVTPDGVLTTLYSFCNGFSCPNGDGPGVALVQSASGDFLGGTSDSSIPGTIFQITPGGTLTILYSFTTPFFPYPTPSALVQSSDGDFYGTTGGGGANCLSDDGHGCGMVFQMTQEGALTTLYSFCAQAGCADGKYPGAALVLATDGNFYGTTESGGANGSYGTIFRITPTGELTTLYSFCAQHACQDGARPAAALVQATDGNFYGTTKEGGANDKGTVFSLSTGLAPFVEALPLAGYPGSVVNILGTNLTGATSVTFNGAAASFIVESASLITATVPGGSTTGPIQVVTPGGTLSSNIAFHVLP